MLFLQHFEFRYLGGLVGGVGIDLRDECNHAGAQRLDERRDDRVDVVDQDRLGVGLGLFALHVRGGSRSGRLCLADQDKRGAILETVLLEGEGGILEDGAFKDELELVRGKGCFGREGRDQLREGRCVWRRDGNVESASDGSQETNLSRPHLTPTTILPLPVST